MQALRDADVYPDGVSADAAAAKGRGFCSKLEAGGDATGYGDQKIAADFYCPTFVAGFVVIPTPEEQEAELIAGLKSAGEAGYFSSDAAAVAHAMTVCKQLDNGGPQQGVSVDAVAVTVYCPDYESGFKTLEPIHVKGTFELLEYDPSAYYPSISDDASGCYGDGGYSDIGPGTQVEVTDNAGTVLTTTVLGRGEGISGITCEFPFEFTVMDGAEGGYVVSVSDRGDLHYSATELGVPGSVAITLGE